jgi:hypothetical protein
LRGQQKQWLVYKMKCLHSRLYFVDVYEFQQK